jgi:hypothetical protein
MRSISSGDVPRVLASFSRKIRDIGSGASSIRHGRSRGGRVQIGPPGHHYGGRTSGRTSASAESARR